jgi:hypothetical protein
MVQGVTVLAPGAVAVLSDTNKKPVKWKVIISKITCWCCDRVAAQRRVVLARLGNDWIKGVPQ